MNFEMKNNDSNDMEYDCNDMEYDSNDKEIFNYGMENGGSYEAEASSQFYCLMCEQSHELAVCTNFIALSPDERTMLCKNNNVCFKCLEIGHRATVCPSRNRCGSCFGPHHSALHGSSPPQSNLHNNASSFVANKVSFAVKPATPAPRAAATPTAPQESA